MSLINSQRLFQNPLFVIGMITITINVLVSLGGANIRPDSSPFANNQYLELAVLKPMTRVSFLKVPRAINAENESWLNKYFVGSAENFELIPFDSITIDGDNLVIKKYREERFERFAISTLKVIEEDQKLGRWNVKDFIEEKTMVLGTDKYGRDLFSRLMAGTYISLSVGLISVAISLILGILLGLWAGYYRGWHDRIILWLINVVWSVPTLLLVISITLVLGKGFWQIFVAVGLTMWVEVARVVRGQVLSMREKEFVEAGRVLGMSNMRIMIRHILPNISGPIIVISAANFATAILLEAGLSFLGIGSPPPQATWGKMISEHKAFLITGDAHLALLPGIAIMLLVLSFTFIGNALRDANDERILLKND
ncbi:MAG: ABC transporter permease [Vicingaceae bacterium]